MLLTHAGECTDRRAARAGAGRDGGQRDHLDVVVDSVEEQLGGGLRGDRRTRRGNGPEPQHAVDRCARVHAIDEVRVAHLEGDTETDVQPDGGVRGTDSILQRQRGTHCVGTLAEHRDHAVAFVHRTDDAATSALDDARNHVVEAGHRGAHLLRVLVPEATRVGDLGCQQRDHTRGQVGAGPAAQPFDQLPGRGRAPGRVDRERGAQRSGERTRLGGIDVGPRRSFRGRQLPIEQGHDGGGEAVDVGRRPRLLPGGHLGCHVAAGTNTAERRLRARDVEVDQHDLPRGCAHQIGGFHITVDDGRHVPVKMVERRRGLGDVAQHLRQRQPWVALVVEHPLEVDAVDPIHHHDVAVRILGEEVTANHRQRGVRGDVQEHAGLGEQLLPIGVVRHRVDLQRDESIVLTVERLQHGRASALADRPHHFVAGPEDFHVNFRHRRRGRRARGPRG